MSLHNPGDVGSKRVVQELDGDDAGKEQQCQCKGNLFVIPQAWCLLLDSCSNG